MLLDQGIHLAKWSISQARLVKCNCKFSFVTWFEVSDSRSHTLHHTSPFVTQHSGEAHLLLALKQVI